VSKFWISSKADENLYTIMSELDIDRPTALKLALAKGLVEVGTVREPKKIKDHKREIPLDAVVKDDFLLIKHLIINQIQRPLEDAEIVPYVAHYINEGLAIMAEEINHLSEMDNYLLYLVTKHGKGD
jgi:hypothetical protein